MKKIKIGLLPRILIAIILGIAVGYVAPIWIARTMATFNYAFSQFLGFLIPFIIIGFVAPAIAELGRNAGRMLVATAMLAYVFTILSGLLSYGTCSAIFPSIISDDPSLALVESQGAVAIVPYFNLDIPSPMEVMTALVFAFMLGVGIAYVDARGVLARGASEFRDIVQKTIVRIIIPLLPVYIFGIFLNMTVSGETGTVLHAFVKVIVVIFALHVFLLVAQYCIAALFARRNPFKMLWTMMPAYFTALGTQSSAATIPVTLRQTIKMGVSESVAGFVVPLCATIHLSGSTLKIVACALALMILQGMPHDFTIFFHFIAMLGITMIAAPGIPGGAIMASLGLLSSILGFTDEQNALMIALYIAMDSFGTACNVTGDGAIACIINRFFGESDNDNASVSTAADA